MCDCSVHRRQGATCRREDRKEKGMEVVTVDVTTGGGY